MIGGEPAVVDRLAPLFASIAPGVDAAARTPGRDGDPGQDEQGYLHCGPVGAGHFVKMVHNGIEYGLMAAYAEGLNILHNANAGKTTREADAETAPLEHPEYYQYDLDVAAIAEVWRRGQRRGVLAARPDRRGAPPVARPVRLLRPRVRLRRGPLDRDRGHRRGRPRPGPDRRALLPLRLPRPGPLRQPGPVGDAQGVWRARGEGGVGRGRGRSPGPSVRG